MIRSKSKSFPERPGYDRETATSHWCRLVKLVGMASGSACVRPASACAASAMPPASGTPTKAQLLGAGRRSVSPNKNISFFTLSLDDLSGVKVTWMSSGN